jgi:hypothetical protein
VTVPQVHEVAEGHVVPRVARDADDPGVGVCSRHLRQCDVGVDEAVRRHRDADDREQVRLRAEVLGEHVDEPRTRALLVGQVLQETSDDLLEVGQQVVVRALRAVRRGVHEVTIGG